MFFREKDLEKNNIFKKAVAKNDFSNLMANCDFLNREIYITNITPIVADEVEKAIRFWNDIDELEEHASETKKPIKIFIDCYGGGSLMAMFTIIDAIKLSRCPVVTINIGAVCREALYIFLAGSRRLSYPRATFMFKKGLKPFDVEDNPASNYADFCDRQEQELKAMLFEKTKISENEYDKREIWWLTAEKAYELKICTEVVRSRTLSQF